MPLQRTPLYDAHIALGARLVEFGGWEMPVQYEGIVAEHRACREVMALFDVSHMGEIAVAGDRATEFLEGLLTNRVADLPVGRCRYTLLCADDGGVVDDLLLYRREADWLLVVNAANIAGDLAWLEARAGTGVEVTNLSEATALLALQGPASPDLLGRLTDPERLAGLKYYRYARFSLFGHEVLISRTGYTGSPGYEIMAPAAAALSLWDGLLGAGAPAGLVPAGLGARDTLRLEAGLPLHGHEISRERDPLSAGLGRFVVLDKPFVGRDALARLAATGPARRLLGLEVLGRQIIREGCPILAGEETVGVITSGSFSPLLERSIGLGLIDAALAEPGREVAVEVRGRPVPCRLVQPPFYRAV